MTTEGLPKVNPETNEIGRTTGIAEMSSRAGAPPLAGAGPGDPGPGVTFPTANPPPGLGVEEGRVEFEDWVLLGPGLGGGVALVVCEDVELGTGGQVFTQGTQTD